MKFKYIEETDTFYLILSDDKSVESEEIAEDIVVDYNQNGKLIGFEILSAKSKIDFNNLLFDSMPFKKVNIINEVVAV